MLVWSLLFILLVGFGSVESRFALRRRYRGRATWFVPSKEGGSLGACGPREEDNEWVVALNADQYGDMSKKSQYCGKYVRIRCRGVTVVARVNDACPECGYGDLDLTQPVFNQLGTLATGTLPIIWEFI